MSDIFDYLLTRPTHWELTGNRRHRVQKWTGLLILQVEERSEVFIASPIPKNKWLPVVRWRDARPDEMSAGDVA